MSRADPFLGSTLEEKQMHVEKGDERRIWWNEFARGDSRRDLRGGGKRFRLKIGVSRSATEECEEVEE